MPPARKIDGVEAPAIGIPASFTDTQGEIGAPGNLSTVVVYRSYTKIRRGEGSADLPPCGVIPIGNPLPGAPRLEQQPVPVVAKLPEALHLTPLPKKPALQIILPGCPGRVAHPSADKPSTSIPTILDPHTTAVDVGGAPSRCVPLPDLHRTVPMAGLHQPPRTVPAELLNNPVRRAHRLEPPGLVVLVATGDTVRVLIENRITPAVVGQVKGLGALYPHAPGLPLVAVALNDLEVPLPPDPSLEQTSELVVLVVGHDAVGVHHPKETTGIVEPVAPGGAAHGARGEPAALIVGVAELEEIREALSHHPAHLVVLVASQAPLR